MIEQANRDKHSKGIEDLKIITNLTKRTHGECRESTVLNNDSLLILKYNKF